MTLCFKLFPKSLAVLEPYFTMWKLAFAFFSLSWARCPNGFIESNTYNRCYSVSTSRVPWTQAEYLCMRMGGHLASISSSQQNSYIYGLVKNLGYPVWIGANVMYGRWMNSDGTGMYYQNFQNSIRDPFNHSVASMITGTGTGHGEWNIDPDEPGYNRPFICEVPKCFSNYTAAPSLLNPNATIPGMYYSSLSNSWFYGSPSTQDYIKDAKAACQSAGGNLPSISNAFENTEFLTDVIPALLGTQSQNPFLFQVVIGYESDTRGVWTWMDDNHSTYTYWDIGEPFFSVDMFSVMTLYAGKWQAKLDSLPMYYVCQLRQRNLYC